MTTFDFTPLFRSAIGFDKLADALESAYRSGSTGGYPPYDIELTGQDKYRITMAVAGFSRDDLDIQVKENILRVSGARQSAEGERKFLHHGIANRNFERTFQLADYVRVKTASMENGLLHVDLEREIPEAIKPRKIQIDSNQASDKLIEGQVKAA